ncbi:MAG: sugar phosphate isomerase/epimerase [Gemmatimonadota bacterium]|jgi:sugar phosphate isomerase/epimerase|nr:sugar phosphate isomerase/epimerase [Gemmatimonadota bacterium]MBA4160246.1 sugar phosphate isomerase/epimerase [Gemmatimonadota bacterium]MDQ3605373.1 sugar phosphate isomerase/epimerase [Gemmatimonadota bacterium]
MHLAFSSNAFTSFSLDDAIREIARLGYAGIEILCDHPHAVPERLSPERIREIAEAVEGAKLRISNLNAFPTCYMGDVYHPSWIHEGEAERRVEYTRRCLELARRWGVPHLSTLPGGTLDEGMDREAALERFREGLEALYDDCRRAGARILIEPEPGLLIETSAEFLDFAEDLDPECVGLNFDIGHFFCVDEDPVELVPRLARWTGHYHLEDIHENRFHYHLIPGRGAIDIPGVLEAIRKTGYQDFVTVEVYPRAAAPVEAARESIEYLRKLNVGI